MIKMDAHQYYFGNKKLLVATDCIIFGFDQGKLKVLLFKRRVEPFKDQWSLIGSFIKENESISEAAKRTLLDSTGLSGVFMEELGAYGEVDRDVGARVISIAYYALIPLEESIIELVATHQAGWFEINDIPPLILDHNHMVADALEKLGTKARHQPIGFELLPQKFTIPQLKSLYDAIYQTTLDISNFRKKILAMDVLKKLNEKDYGSSKRGAYLFQFDRKKYQRLVEKGFNFEV